MKERFKTYGLNLWRWKNENGLICQKIQMKAHNPAKVETETGSYINKTGRATTTTKIWRRLLSKLASTDSVLLKKRIKNK